MTIRGARGRLDGPEARLRRRRQQRGPLAGRGLGPARASSSSWLRPPGYEFPAEFRDRFAEPFPGGPAAPSSTTRARPSPAPTWSTPTSGPAWARSTRPTSAREVFAPYQVERGPAGPGPRGRHLPPLPARPPRRGSDLGRARRPAQPGHPPGRQSAALPDGPPGLAAGRPDAGRTPASASRSTPRDDRERTHDPTRRPEPRSTPTRDDRARLRPQQPRQRALPGGRDGRAGHGPDLGDGAAVPGGQGGRLADGRVRDAARAARRPATARRPTAAPPRSSG